MVTCILLHVLLQCSRTLLILRQHCDSTTTRTTRLLQYWHSTTTGQLKYYQVVTTTTLPLQYYHNVMNGNTCRSMSRDTAPIEAPTVDILRNVRIGDIQTRNCLHKPTGTAWLCCSSASNDCCPKHWGVQKWGPYSGPRKGRNRCPPTVGGHWLRLEFGAVLRPPKKEPGLRTCPRGKPDRAPSDSGRSWMCWGVYALSLKTAQRRCLGLIMTRRCEASMLSVHTSKSLIESYMQAWIQHTAIKHTHHKSKTRGAKG